MKPSLCSPARSESRSSESQAAQPFRTRSAGDDPCAALHHHLDAARVVRFDRGDIFEVNQMRSVDTQEIRGRQVGLQIGQADADEVLLRRGENRRVIIGSLYAFNTGQRHWDDAMTIA